ncbi:MAG: hypothetical protein F4Y49_02350 [Dehalococcoidia bacterium]|nr:hypothetical protein [Dehalococcoidia bacterium]
MLQGKHYRFTIPDMNTWEMVKSASRKAESWAVSMVDALPPYYVMEGILESKRIDDKGRYVLLVSGAPISVDRPTYHILDAGEHIRVRYTRGARAISIDRFVDSNGHR